MPGWINPYAGKLGLAKYAGWDDWYIIYVDGDDGKPVYFVRARASEIEPYLVEEGI
jgi:hypothetical protein